MTYHFEIIGSKKRGDYKVICYEKKVEHKITGNTRSGLKEARQFIAQFLQSIVGEDMSYKATHCHIKPGRDNERSNVFDWTIDQYIKGTPPPQTRKYSTLSSKALSSRNSIEGGRKL